MAGTFATIIVSGGYGSPIHRAMSKAQRGGCDTALSVRVQPIPNDKVPGLAYLVVKHARSSAKAESVILAIMNEYRALGGPEYNEDVLPRKAEAPAIKGLWDDAVKPSRDYTWTSKEKQDCLRRLEMQAKQERWDREHAQYSKF